MLALWQKKLQSYMYCGHLWWHVSHHACLGLPRQTFSQFINSVRGYLARLGLPTVFHQKNVPESIINLKLIWSKWLDIGLESRSINSPKKNLANIQPSWPHTWLITHTLSHATTCYMRQQNYSRTKNANKYTTGFLRHCHNLSSNGEQCVTRQTSV